MGDNIVENVIYIVSTANFIKDFNDISDCRWYDIIYRITCLIGDKRLNLSDTTVETIVAKLYNIKAMNDLKSYWSIVKRVFELFGTETELNVNVQFKIWLHIAENIPDYFTNKILLLWKDNEIALAFSFAVWPLKNTVRNMVRNEMSYILKKEFVLWLNLIYFRQHLMRNGLK